MHFPQLLHDQKHYNIALLNKFSTYRNQPQEIYWKKTMNTKLILFGFPFDNSP